MFSSPAVKFPLEDAIAESSPSPRVRAAARQVIDGFGGEDRREKPIDLLVLEAFQDAIVSLPEPLPPLAPLVPSRRRVDAAIASLRERRPVKIALSDDEACGDDNIGRLCSSLLAHRALTELRLPNTGCGFPGASSIAELVAVHLKLRLLDLSRNPAIGDAGGGALGRALRASCALEQLKLRSCGIGDDGASAIASAIAARRGNAPLTHLDLSFNSGIGAVGVDALRDAASRCGSGKLALDLAGASATPAQLAAAQLALTPEGRRQPNGAELWRQGVHSAYTLRFADASSRVSAVGDAEASLSLIIPPARAPPPASTGEALPLYADS